MSWPMDEWLIRRAIAGWKPEAIVAASDGTVTRRTAYRWLRTIVRLETVRLGDHEAVYAIRRDCPPVRLSPWTQLGDKPLPDIETVPDSGGVKPTAYRGLR